MVQDGHFTPDQIRMQIKQLVASVTEREPDEIPDSALFKDDLGVDSLLAMELMITIDKKFGIDIPEDEFTKAQNVDEAVLMVQRFLPAASVAQAS
jgi:acyl carrier protein